MFKENQSGLVKEFQNNTIKQRLNEPGLWSCPICLRTFLQLPSSQLSRPNDRTPHQQKQQQQSNKEGRCKQTNTQTNIAAASATAKNFAADVCVGGWHGVEFMDTHGIDPAPSLRLRILGGRSTESGGAQENPDSQVLVWKNCN